MVHGLLRLFLTTTHSTEQETEAPGQSQSWQNRLRDPGSKPPLRTPFKPWHPHGLRRHPRPLQHFPSSVPAPDTSTSPGAFHLPCGPRWPVLNPASLNIPDIHEVCHLPRSLQAPVCPGWSPHAQAWHSGPLIRNSSVLRGRSGSPEDAAGPPSPRSLVPTSCLIPT